MLTVVVFALEVARWLWCFVHIYDLNIKAHSIIQSNAEKKKQIANYEMKKQVLEQTVQLAKDMGSKEGNSDDSIHFSGQNADGD